MNDNDFEFLCHFLGESSGLSIGPGKEYLVEARLLPLAQSWELQDITELVAELKKGANPRLSSAVNEAMTTNETSFFRDKRPFEDFRKVMLPALMNSRQTTRVLRIWCAASSTGQEPYSLAMILDDEFPSLKDWKIDIIATDLSTEVLDRAAEGIYTQFEVQRGLPVQMLMKHFDQVQCNWQIKEELRRRIRWQKLNLQGDFRHLGSFDIVFCRNVLIYFETTLKRDILDRARSIIRNDGYLVLGAAETVIGISQSYSRLSDCQSTIYQPTVGQPSATIK